LKKYWKNIRYGSADLVNDKYFSHNQMNLTIIKIGGSVITDKKAASQRSIRKT